MSVASWTKHAIKLFFKSLLNRLNFYIIFPGEKTENGLYPFFLEFLLVQSKGILHLGAHHGEEANYYLSLNKRVLWIEADPIAFDILSRQIAGIQNQTAVRALISDTVREETFHVTSNNGMSSSIHPLSSLGKSKWKIENNKVFKMRTETLNNLLCANNEEYDFWIIDVQGHEWEVLKGGDKVIAGARWILIEGSKQLFYEKMTLFSAVKELLESHGFIQIYCQNSDHFEAVFVNSQAK